MIASRSRRRRLKVTPCLAQAAVPTMLCQAIPITIDRIRGLNVVIPGSMRIANDVAATSEASNRPGRMARAPPTGHRRATDAGAALRFSDSVGLLAEIRVTSWLH